MLLFVVVVMSRLIYVSNLSKILSLNLYKYRRKALRVLTQTQRQSSSIIKPPKRILFFGTDNFSLPSLEALHKNSNAEDLGVVTSFKSPANCVRNYAVQERLPLLRWPVAPAQCEQYELGVVVSFGHLIPADIIKSLPFGMINVHASLLPRWRGAAPIIYAIMHGDRKTGVSIMKIEPHHFDIGDILAQREIRIDKTDICLPTLRSELAHMGAELLVKTIHEYPASLRSAKKQNAAEATYAPKVTNAITNIDWSTMCADQLHRRYRALLGYKSLVSVYQGKQVQLLDVRLPYSLPKHLPREPGSFIYQREHKTLLLCCAACTYLEVLQLRMEGKKIMTASDFNNGFLKQLKTAELLFSQNKKIAC